MNFDFFSNGVGFLGNTSYSLKYISNTRNLRYTWPHNNIFARCNDENSILQSILRQQVGIDRSSTYLDECSELKPTLRKFLANHTKTNYLEVLKKCYPLRFNENCLQPTPKYVVKEYVHRLIHNVIPLALFGNEAERRIFERNARQILHLGKAQVFSLNMLMRNARTKNKTYLKPLDGNVDKTNLLAKLYLWLLRCYIFAALKCVFYVTDSNSSKKYFFYYKHTWQKIQQRGFNQMKKNVMGTYKNCLITRAVSSYDLYVLRILPKRRGSRPIYMKWKRETRKPRFSAPLVKIVRQFFLQLAERNFAYVQKMSNFHQQWEALYLRWTALERPPIYFVKVDFLNAYGSILHTKLLESIEKLIEKNQYTKEIQFLYRKNIKRVPVRYIFAIIENYVTKFMYKHNKKIYKLAEGIPQGGPLSSVLCNYYFGEMDLEYLTEFGDDNSGFLVRNCDDYLYMTLDLVKAIKFLDRLSNGFPDYNLKLNNLKTETNIFSSPDTVDVVRISTFELNISTFQLYQSVKSYKNNSIFHTSFLKTVSYPGQIVAKRLPSWASLNLKQLYFDTLYNSTLTILFNTFQTAYLTAARFVSFIEVLFGHFNYSFILKCVLRSASRMASSVLEKATNLGDDVSRALLMWIILRAFSLRFQTENRNRYATILRRVNLILSTWSTKFSQNEIMFLEKLRSDQRVQALRSIL